MGVLVLRKELVGITCSRSLWNGIGGFLAAFET